MTLREAFTSEHMEQIKRITLQLKTEATAAGGRRKSRAKGQSVEFSDFRNYVTGDNVRSIDWKSYGRLDKLIIKLFLEERQANVNIILDTSGSMGFGGKGLQAELLCACLGYMFMLNMDRVSFYPLNMTPLQNLTSPSSINRAVDYLDGIAFDGEIELSDSIRSLPLKQGSCIIISDFFTNENKAEIFKLLAYKKQKISAVMLLDKTELNPEQSEERTLEDCENGSTMPVTLDKAAIKKYKQALDAHLAETANAAKRVQGRFAAADTEMSVLKIVKGLSQMR